MLLSVIIYAASHIIHYTTDSLVKADVVIGDFKASFVDLDHHSKKKLANKRDIKGIYENHGVDLYDVEIQQPLGDLYGLDRIDARKGYDKLYTYPKEAGEGVTVFIVDTGVQVEHLEFENRARWGIDTTGEGMMDKIGHGTHVAGIVASKTYGAAKKAEIVSVKVISKIADPIEYVIKGLEWVANEVQSKKLKAVVNMSLGSEYSKVFNEAVAAVVKLGIPVIAAAGNAQKDACGYSPASEESAITVGATDRSDTKAFMSNWGPCIDIHAPGIAIVSTWKGPTNTKVVGNSGTSMAAPFVTAVAALHLSQGKKNIKELILKNATPNVLKLKPNTNTINLFLYNK